MNFAASALEKNRNYHPQFFYINARISYKNVTVRKNPCFRGIDTNKTSASKECMICHYWYFKNVGFKFEAHVCNKCHNVLMTAYELEYSNLNITYELKYSNIECKRC